MTGFVPPDEFVRRSTDLASPPLVPEIRLHLSTDVYRLWQDLEQREGRSDLPPPFWGFAWAGGQALARYLLDNPRLVQHKRVLDVAAGCAVAGIAAVRCGARSVVANDPDPLAAAAARLNADVNDAYLEVYTDDLLDGDGQAADVVLVGDAWYEHQLAERMLGFIERVCARGATVLIGDPGRTYLPRDRLRRLATYDVPVSRSIEDADVKPTTVFTLDPPH